MLSINYLTEANVHVLEGRSSAFNIQLSVKSLLTLPSRIVAPPSAGTSKIGRVVTALESEQSISTYECAFSGLLFRFLKSGTASFPSTVCS